MHFVSFITRNLKFNFQERLKVKKQIRATSKTIRFFFYNPVNINALIVENIC